MKIKETFKKYIWGIAGAVIAYVLFFLFKIKLFWLLFPGCPGDTLCMPNPYAWINAYLVFGFIPMFLFVIILGFILGLVVQKLWRKFKWK